VTGISLPLLASGKVRELYAVGDDHLLLVASDRISAFDWVLPDPVPDKGRILTAMTEFWFGQLGSLVPNHLVAGGSNALEQTRSLLGEDPFGDQAEYLRGRTMLCRRLTMVPAECVARGYLAGSGWSDYRATGSVCGVALPGGLRDGDRLPSPIFTPATKAAEGHDENISAERLAAIVGEQMAADLARLTLEVYAAASRIAEAAGIIIADTKFEFGHDRSGQLTLGDEVLTPDSSRFWPADAWQPGRAQPSLDKQPVRDYLAALPDWDRNSPPPALPATVTAETRQRYIAAYEALTGGSFEEYLANC
jgi:phosphoribosylaminoimidazole-succinocarboxamide synthase